MDGQIGRLLNELEARGALENTIVVITSDHGEQFSEHGLSGHSNSLYSELVRVPLLISWPGRVPEGQRTPAAASLRSLPSTLIELAGVGDRHPFPAPSLRPLWEPAAPDAEGPTPFERATAFAQVDISGFQEHPGPLARGPLRAVVQGRWHYIRNGDAVEELFDTVADPEQERNLAADPEHLPVLRRMRAALREAALSP